MKFLMMILLVVSSVSFAATDVQLDSKKINLGNLGDIRKVADFDKKGEFNLIRSEATPAKVKLTYAFKSPQMVCTQTRVVPYFCGGGYNRGGYGRPYPPRGGYGRGGYGRGGYRSTCFRTECVRYEEQLITKVRSLKLNFRRANALASGESEEVLLNLISSGRSVGYDVVASDYTDIKKRRKSVKFKN